MEFKDLKFIAQGFIHATRSRSGLADPEVEKLAAERYETCLGCEIISDDKIRCDKDKGGCNCILSWKTRSDSECPKKKW